MDLPLDARAALAQIVPEDLGELLHHAELALPRPVWGVRHGRHRSPRIGQGLEFRDHRAYVPGDDPRGLDWRAFARRERPVIRQSEAEQDLNVIVVLDASANMDYGITPQHKFYVARALTAALASTAVGQGDRVGLVLGYDGRFDTSYLRPASGNERLHGIALRLQALLPTGTIPIDDLLATLAPRLPARSVVIFVSDIIDYSGPDGDAITPQNALFQQLSQLRRRQHEVAIIQILHPDEIRWPWDDTEMLRLLDPRGVRSPIEGPARGLREGYMDRIRDHLSLIESTCRSSGLFLFRTLGDEPLAPTFTRLLRYLAGIAEPGMEPGER